MCVFSWSRVICLAGMPLRNELLKGGAPLKLIDAVKVDDESITRTY